MFRSISARTMFASLALTLLLGVSSAVAQDDGLIEAPTPAVLEPPADAQALDQAEPELLPPEALSVDADDMIDYRKDDIATIEGGDCDCGQCGDSNGCGCEGQCRRGNDLFGYMRRMLDTCAAHKHARCAGCYDHPRLCGNNPMTCADGVRHDPNRTPHASGQLFRQYYAQPRSGGVSAQMYVAPYPVPASVGHTAITYQAFEPHQFMYRHKRKYVRRHGPGGGTTTTRVYWW